MKRTILIISGVLALSILGVVVLNGGAGKQNNDSATHSANSSSNDVKPGQNEVIISDFAFQPSKITIKKGTTVTWTNRDSAHHDITPDQPSDNFKASKLLSKGESYSFTFNTAGHYSYHCSPHPYMKANIEVTE
jgi:plastocyanin